MAAFKAYLAALWEEWWALIGGSVVMLALGLVDPLTGRRVPAWLYLSVLLVFVVMATFRAWAKQHKARVKAELQLDARPRVSLFFDPADPECLSSSGEDTTFRVGIVNSGGRRAEDVFLTIAGISGTPTPTDGVGNSLMGYAFAEGYGLNIAPSIVGRPTDYVSVLTHSSRSPLDGFQTLACALPLKGSRAAVLSATLELWIRAEGDFPSDPIRLQFTLPVHGTPTATAGK